jgi:galactose mutarotase-like enzyme
MGGKITSLIVRGHGSLAGSQDRELLHPPVHPYSKPTETSNFALSDAGGWDECLPTVAPCIMHGVEFADHGDIWRRSWDAVVRNEALLTHVSASSVPLRFSRHLSLDGPTMHLRYSVTNTGSHGVDFLWSAHPLFQVQEGDRIVLPEAVHQVYVEDSTLPNLALTRGCASWPRAELTSGGHVDLSTVGPRDGRTAHKLFAGPLPLGWCALYREQLKLGIVMRFDPGQTPFAGLWISQGAWPPAPGTEAARKQYTVAIEPTMAPCDALDRAVGLGRSQHLLPQGEFSWPLQFEVFGSHTPVRYDEFLHLVSTPPRH